MFTMFNVLFALKLLRTLFRCLVNCRKARILYRIGNLGRKCHKPRTVNTQLQTVSSIYLFYRLFQIICYLSVRSIEFNCSKKQAVTKYTHGIRNLENDRFKKVDWNGNHNGNHNVAADKTLTWSRWLCSIYTYCYMFMLCQQVWQQIHSPCLIHDCILQHQYFCFKMLLQSMARVYWKYHGLNSSKSFWCTRPLANHVLLYKL